MENVTIRPYRREDERHVIDLWVRCNLTVPWNNPKEDIERKMKEAPDLLFVGEIENRIVASCMAGYDGHRGWIYYLAVSPERRGGGLAKQMVRRAEERLKEMGCPKINLMVRKTNTGVIDFYKKVGYNDDPVVVLSKRLKEDPEYNDEQA